MYLLVSFAVNLPSWALSLNVMKNSWLRGSQDRGDNASLGVLGAVASGLPVGSDLTLGMPGLCEDKATGETSARAGPPLCYEA